MNFSNQIEEEEGGDQFSLEISITEPKKVGDGMNAYMAYKVNTKVNKWWTAFVDRNCNGSFVANRVKKT